MKFPCATSPRASRPVAVRLLTAGLLTMTLAGCGGGSWFGDSEPPPPPGERVSVPRLARHLEQDPNLAALRVELPAATVNTSWPQAGGNPDHAMEHLSLAAQPREVWRAD